MTKGILINQLSKEKLTFEDIRDLVPIYNNAGIHLGWYSWVHSGKGLREDKAVYYPYFAWSLTTE